MRRSLLAVAALLAACAAPPTYTATVASPGAPVMLSGGAAPAPAVAFTDLAGTAHTLAEFKGQNVLYVAFAYWCPHCQEDMPKLQAWIDQHPHIAFVPVESSGGSLADTSGFRDTYGLKGPVYYDATKQAGPAMNVKSYPTAYLIGADATIIETDVGLPPLDRYAQMLNEAP